MMKPKVSNKKSSHLEQFVGSASAALSQYDTYMQSHFVVPLTLELSMVVNVMIVHSDAVNV